MSTDDRIKRPTLERTDPIRNWSTLFGAPGSAPGSGENAAGDGRGAALQDVVSRSVDLGYRVVDEYIRRGQKTAQRLSERSYTPEIMANDLQELTTRMGQYASDFAGVWFELLQRAAGSVAARPAAAAEGSATAAAAATANGAAATPSAPAPQATAAPELARVIIEVVSARPAEVSLDIQPQATTRRLLVQALRAVDPDKPRLTEVVLRSGSADEPLRLRLRVPDDQPPGIYNGLVIDEESSRPVGTLSVRIAAP